MEYYLRNDSPRVPHGGRAQRATRQLVVLDERVLMITSSRVNSEFYQHQRGLRSHAHTTH